MKFIAGFIFNTAMMLFNLPMMSLDFGKICHRENKWPWEFNDMEICEKLEKVDEE